ncbi:EAL domain-containing protein [Qipengyuania nanhaisediminis]|uniref:EAL domain, c-di-GMP-specific phosphodiesterase class I (Or its enzymatically inactive variant) n=1 Tax=Qipengyuania nanhaisediminis TaxID=604088 RepID=A0A1I5LKU5_9SPHN|nr:EAL domain-containing protein [Qipengyuania nanhaisediminis]SFO97757.1 EAL domain, c-di-GMP-specific phosphodiesterase class I (or its enzymatically inactive variant) [Qipengyuania nanhaisediminis]
MDEKTTLAPAPEPRDRKPSGERSEGKLKRLQHLLWSGAVAFVMLATMMLGPLDQFLWMIQSRAANQQPSGDIVFVGSAVDVEGPSRAAERRQLADGLDRLREAGASKVYLDFILHKGDDTLADARLAEAIKAYGNDLILVDQVKPSLGGDEEVLRSDALFDSGGGRVSTDRWTNWLGYTWKMDATHEIYEETPLFAASLAGQEKFSRDEVLIDYGFDPDLIPAYRLAQLIGGDIASSSLKGKAIVVGPASSDSGADLSIPGKYNPPPSYPAIYAAETFKSGRDGFVGAFPLTLAFAAALAAAILLSRRKKVRRFAYAAIALALPGALFGGAYLGFRTELAYAGMLLFVYAAQRSRARWRLRVANIDNDTGLEKLRVIERAVSQNFLRSGHIVVARLQGLEQVLKTLGSAERSSYILRLVDRLRAADQELAIYIDGHFLAWHSTERDTSRLIEHLEGLRAIFAAPIKVGSESVDVGITFGVASIGEAGRNSVAAAAAAAEETSEAHEPIKIAQIASHHDELWDISLRARIDAAMEAGEIYCVYQPKIDMISGSLTGVEALVRWHDPERGFISPIKFIAQCEKAGRMEHLTRYVLQTACNAGRLMHFRGSGVSMSVNISATLLNDMRIVGIVRNTLQATGFDPQSLILEITETARIGDLAKAATILDELKSLGLKISMDDFGVGAANFETFYGLPFDELKIDRLFVDSISRSEKAKAIASSIIAMGRAARITVVAEGAEDDKTLQILNEIGCRYVQGYALARPLSLTNLLEFKDSYERSQTGT